MLDRTAILTQGPTVDDDEVNEELKQAFYASKYSHDWDQFILNTRYVIEGVITYMDGTAELVVKPTRVHNPGPFSATNQPRHYNKRKPNKKTGYLNYETGCYEPKRIFANMGECVPYLPNSIARIEFRAKVQRGIPVHQAFEDTLAQHA